MPIAEAVTPRRVLRLFLPAGMAVFFLGHAGAAAIFFGGRPWDAKAAILSDLESPVENPRGYRAGAAGTAACGLLLTPAAICFFERLRVYRRKWALAGGLLFGAGLAAATAIGLLAPFTRGYTPLHVQLAYAAFIGICAGTLIFLGIASVPARRARGRKTAQGIAALNGAVLGFLLYLYFGPEYFDNGRLLTSLAFCEWMLCADCAASLWLLAAVVARTGERT